MSKEQRSVALILVLMLVAMVPGVSLSDDWQRGGKEDFLFTFQSMEPATMRGQAAGINVAIDMDRTYAGGFEGGWNISNYLQLGLDVYLGGNSATASSPSSSVVLHSSVLFLALYGRMDINILPYRFTPLVTGGVGVRRMGGAWKSEVGVDSTFDETNFSWEGGVGVRWNVTDRFLMKAMYRFMWVNVDGASSPLRMDGFTLGIGFTR
jgi:opacity protein-like surface antigen